MWNPLLELGIGTWKWKYIVHTQAPVFIRWVGELYTVTVKHKYEQLMIQEHQYQTYPVAKKKKKNRSQVGGREEKRREERKKEDGRILLSPLDGRFEFRNRCINIQYLPS